MRALLRQATILSLVARVVAPCAFTPLDSPADGPEHPVDEGEPRNGVLEGSIRSTF